MDKVQPVTCFGYHFVNNIDEGDVPVSIPYTTSDVAEKQGWTTTDYNKFSFDGSVVWLCPSCSERWNKEREQLIHNIITTIHKIHCRYVIEHNALERGRLIDWFLRLKNDFMELSPTIQEWKLFEDAQSTQPND